MTDLRVMNTMNAICQEDDYPKKREHVAFSTMNDIGSLASCNYSVAYSAHFLRLVLVKTRLDSKNTADVCCVGKRAQFPKQTQESGNVIWMS